jgi:hypothetical protein
MATRIPLAAVLFAAILTCPMVHAQSSDDKEELAKAAQNPVGDLISLPFQENLNLNSGPLEKNQSVLNIQPVIPINLNGDWNIITRTILPVISQPAFAANQDRTNGIGDTQISALLSPAKPGAWIWGVGAITQLPTHSKQVLGNDNVGFGPTFVLLHLDRGSPWVYGFLANNIWSSSNSTGASYNNGLIQPFINYNINSGLYLTTSPVITVNWQAKGSQQWTVPMGGGVGKIFKIGKLPLNSQISGYYNVTRPDFASNWQIRFQVQLLFPK